MLMVVVKERKVVVLRRRKSFDAVDRLSQGRNGSVEKSYRDSGTKKNICLFR